MSVPEKDHIRVSDVTCPKIMDEWQWNQVLEELGDLVIADVVGVAMTPRRQDDGRIVMVEHALLSYRKPEIDRFASKVRQVLGINDDVVSEGGEPWAQENPDAWRGETEEDETIFGPQPDWWKT